MSGRLIGVVGHESLSGITYLRTSKLCCAARGVLREYGIDYFVREGGISARMRGIDENEASNLDAGGD